MLLIILLFWSLQLCFSQLCMNDIDVLYSEPNPCDTSDSFVDLRVVGGKNVSSAKAPWHAIFAKKETGKLSSKQVYAGGNLITSSLVLTAAHIFWYNSEDGRVCPKHVRHLQTAEECHGVNGGCPKGCRRITSDDVLVYFGASEINQERLFPHTVEYIEIHEGYNKESETNAIANGHDIAIVKISVPVKMSAKIQPVCLPMIDLEEELTRAENDVFINGFGSDGINKVTDTLQQGCIYIMSNRRCRSKYKSVIKKGAKVLYLFPDGEITGDQICATGKGVDTCNGDSGGGIIKNREGINMIIGITSLGSSSCRNSLPALYTNVFSHLPWIQQQMIQNCSSWSRCNATCNIAGYQTRQCSGFSNNRAWSKAEQRVCHNPLCIPNNQEELERKRLIVLGGWVGRAKQSNTVFMENCPGEGSQIPDLPRNISNGVGAILPFEMPLLLFCGGWIPGIGPTSKCFEYKIGEAETIDDIFFEEASEWNSVDIMQTPRSNAAISIIPTSRNQRHKVWVTGGRSSKNVVLDSTEIFEKRGNVWSKKEGPLLIKKSAAHCQITVEDDHISYVYVIGGAHFDSDIRKFVMTNAVDVYSFFNGEYVGQGRSRPKMKTGRSAHACTLVMNQGVAGGIMVAGGQHATKSMLDSVEYMDLNGGEWKELTPLPRKLTGAKMVMNMGAPILIGGTGYTTEERAIGKKLTDLSFSKDIIEFKNNVWSKKGEIIEKVAYHEVLAISTICLDVKPRRVEKNTACGHEADEDSDYNYEDYFDYEDDEECIQDIYEYEEGEEGESLIDLRILIQ